MFIGSLEKIFGGKARADHADHHVVPPIEGGGVPRFAKHLSVETPELPDAFEVGEVAGGVCLNEAAELVGAIDDVPFGERQEGLIPATGVRGQCAEFFFMSSAEGVTTDGWATAETAAIVGW